MYVQDLGSTHVLLLNKFNVVENHALIVTKVFEEQNSLLTHADMTALWTCLGEIRGVAFYNAGLIAGASQRHKHMQIVPTPLSPDSDCDTPFDNALHSCAPVGEIYASKQLRFMHAVMRMEDCARMAMEGMCEEAGVLGMKRYVEMMGCLEGRIQQGWKEGCRPFGYNLVVTRKWMMIVPRRRECYEGVSVNSLGFVGCLLVRDEEMLSRVRHVGGMQVLRETAFADSMDE